LVSVAIINWDRVGGAAITINSDVFPRGVKLVLPPKLKPETYTFSLVPLVSDRGSYVKTFIGISHPNLAMIIALLVLQYY
jgi:hypothetical protein